MSVNKHLTYRVNSQLDAAEVAELLRDSGINRPVDDLPRIEKMIENANLIVTAWDGARLVGISRSLTDFSYCLYLSDLAVAKAYQKQGIGRELIRHTQECVGDQVMILLLAAPAAKDYYAPLGFDRVDNGWIIPRKR
jgi:predicted N-acetyltransferase YhbS